MKLLAQTPISNPFVTGFVGKSQSDTGNIFGKFFSSLVALLLVGATLWAFIQLILGGISWITAGGDKGRLEVAQQKILQAIIGLGIVFAAWAFYLAILKFLGVTTGVGGGFEFTLPSLL